MGNVDTTLQRQEMTIIANYHTEIGCSYHRVFMPMKHMAARYTTDSVAFIADTVLPSSAAMRNVDIIFFNRVPTFDREKLLAARKSSGFKIVVDIDDHWILYPHHEMAEAWRDSKANEHIQQWITDADMVFVTNERLKIAASQLNSNVYVVPNSLPRAGQFMPNSEVNDGSKMNFLYAAGSSHLHDLMTIKPAMRRLGNDSEFVNKGRIVLAGYEQEYGMGKIGGVWEKMLNVIKPAVSYATLGRRSVHDYMRCYDFANVALAPLERSNFNACKSNLKILEAGAKAIPIIASYVEPYVFDAECPGVILCDTARDWHDAVKRLIRDPVLARKLGSDLSEYTRTKYNIEHMTSLRYNLFYQLI